MFRNIVLGSVFFLCLLVGSESRAEGYYYGGVVYRPAPVYVTPVYVHRVYVAPVYVAPLYVAPVYVAPVYQGIILPAPYVHGVLPGAPVVRILRRW